MPRPIAQSVVLQTWEQEVTGSIPAGTIFFPRIDDSHCNRIHSSLTVVRCFVNGYVGKQPATWKEYCVENWLKELQESMDRCFGHHHITEILLEMVLNTIQHIQPKIWCTEKLLPLQLWYFFICQVCEPCSVKRVISPSEPVHFSRNFVL